MSFSQPKKINTMQIIIVIVDVKSGVADDPPGDDVKSGAADDPSGDDWVWTNAAIPASFGIFVILFCCATAIVLAVALPAEFSW